MIDTSSSSPGLEPHHVFKNLSNSQAEHVLPDGVLKLLSMINRNLAAGPERDKALGRAVRLELVVDDHTKRAIFLGAVPEAKIAELEKRIGVPLTELQKDIPLKHTYKQKFLEFFGPSTTAARSAIAPLPTESIAPARGLFPHQKQVASAAEKFLYHDEGRVMMHLPTGTGKTRTAMSVVASHLRVAGSEARGKKLVLWLANTQEILAQAALEFEETWRAVGDRSVECLRFWENLQPQIETVKEGVIFAGLSKLHLYGKDRERLWNLGDRVTMVVFDEAHQAVAKTYKDIIEAVITRKPRTPLLGLSATPGRTWNNSEEDEALVALFKERKVTFNFNGENPIQHLTRKGYLAEVDISLLNVKPGLSLSAEDRFEISTSLGILEELWPQLNQDQWRILRIVGKLRELATVHSRILVFADSVSNALLLSSVCNGIGLSASAITGNTDAVERKHMIALFKRPGDSCRILINYGVLTTGFDAPKVSAALIARPTMSLVLYQQMVGRVIRGPKAGGTKSCHVVTVIDTSIPGFDALERGFSNWEDEWGTE